MSGERGTQWLAWARSRLMRTKLAHLATFAGALLVSMALLLYACLTSAGSVNVMVSSYKHHVLVDDDSYHLSDMQRIKESVSQELLSLESQRNGVIEQLEASEQRLRQLKQAVVGLENEWLRLQASINQTRALNLELADRSTPQLSVPRQLLVPASRWNRRRSAPMHAANRQRCSLHSCWDYSLCPLGSALLTDVYPLAEPSHAADSATWRLARQLHAALTAQSARDRRGDNSSSVCARLVVLVLTAQSHSSNNNSAAAAVTRYLHALPYWAGDGRNHVLLAVHDGAAAAAAALWTADTGRAMLASDWTPDGSATSLLDHGAEGGIEFRAGFDVRLPHLALAFGDPAAVAAAAVSTLDDDVEAAAVSVSVAEMAVPMVPVRRPLLASFETGPGAVTQRSQLLKVLGAEFAREPVVSELYVDIDCSCDATDRQTDAQPVTQDWCLCGNEQSRRQRLANSTFAVIVCAADFDDRSSVADTRYSRRLWEALSCGAVPVLLGPCQLPLDEVLDWRRATLALASARLPELHYLLRSVTDTDIFTMRRHGVQIWQRYMSSAVLAVRAALTILSERLSLPPPPPPMPSSSHNTLNTDTVFSLNPTRGLASMLFLSDADTLALDPVAEETAEEFLGPVEPPVPSAVFRRNLTVARLYAHQRWNEHYQPHWMSPSLPFDDQLPSDATFLGSSHGFRHINSGAGGSGSDFARSLGGSRPYEQFTAVILAYNRPQILMAAVARLRNVPYLNKVLVVWNGAWPPNSSLQWPAIDAPIQVVRTERNSLNNRFLPLSSIETEAILSLDDDIVLRRDEIVFAFRVWREQRQRLVGFPGRFHAWDPLHGGWHYNSNHSCQLSMVLTGAAFFHKYYSYMYTQWMPAAIRREVDQRVNCEDIAMNFLISHLTRQPPIKTTTRWTFRCDDCPVLLSNDEQHFSERHACINSFTRIYGYNPLLYTQFRADSVLYKTRLGAGEQKCFRIV